MLNETHLHNYQNGAIEHIVNNERCGLFLDMGLGKTVSTLTAIKILMYDELEIEKTLVIAPKRVAENVWTTECTKWSHLTGFKTSRVIGNQKQRKAALAEEADIYLIGIDNVAWLCGQYGGSYLPFDMLVIDESSGFKNQKSLRFKALRKVLTSFVRIVILTGTPAPNGLIDLWSQLFILDGGQRLGKFITQYKKNFFTKGWGAFGKYTANEYAKKAISDKISDICMSMKSEDYLDLPDRIDNYIDIFLPDKILKQYNSFEEQLVMEIIESEEGTEISVANAAALSNKLIQFANGAVYDAEKNIHRIHNLKLDAAHEVVEAAAGKPVLIAYSYKHDVIGLMERLSKFNPVKLSKESHIKDWNEGKIQVLIMHPASGGHGLNLQEGGNLVLWFGQTWNLEHYQQLNKRLHRQGQKNRVIIHHLVAKGTIDEDIISSRMKKSETQNGLMASIKSKIAKYEKSR